MSNQTNQLKAGAIISYIQMALSVVIGLVYTPIMIRLLGQSEYGLYNTVASTISMLSVLSLGFNSSYIRYYSKYKVNNDKNSINKLNGMFLIIFVVIGIVALACGLFLTNNLRLVFDSGLTDSEYVLAKKLMFILSINLAVSFPTSVFSNIISAHEKFVILKLLSVIRTVVSPLLNIPLLLLGYGSVAIVISAFILSLTVDSIFILYTVLKLKQKFVFHGFEKGLFKSLFIYTSFIAINLIVDQINWNIDKFLLGRYKGTIFVAIYSVGYMIYQYYMVFSSAISGVFTPRVHNIINSTNDNPKEQKVQLTQIFVKVGRIQFLILMLIATGFVFFGQPFISFWAGEGYNDAYYVALILMFPATIALTQNVGIEIQRAENKHQFRSIVYLIMAVLNLILSIYLCQKYGAIGSAVGTAFSLVVANGIIMNVYYQKKCNIDVICFWKNICRMCVGLIVPIAIGICMMLFVELYTFWKLLLCIIVYAVVYILSMWLLGMNEYEKGLMKKPLMRRKNDKNS